MNPETHPKRVDNGADADWASLLSRMVDDLSRIIQIEARLVEANLGRAISGAVDRILSQLFLLSAGMAGVLCLLTAMIFLLHKALELWAALAIAGAVVISLGVAGFLIGRRFANKTEHEIVPH